MWSGGLLAWDGMNPHCIDFESSRPRGSHLDKKQNQRSQLPRPGQSLNVRVVLSVHRHLGRMLLHSCTLR